MPFTIPDQGEGDSNLQSIIWQEEWDVLLAGISGIDCVLSGLAVTGGADMTPAVAKGAVLSNRTMFAVAAADVTISAADATNPRLDLIVVNNAGALAVRTGTPGAFVPGTSAPKPPARSANDVVIAIVYVPATDTAIATTQIIDKRVSPSYPVCIYRQTAADTVNTTAAAIEALNRTNSGLTVPDGLFLNPRILRVRMGGNILQNSGVVAVAFAVRYGGTTMFNETGAASVADADRRAWFCEFDLIAQGTSDQSMVGQLQCSDLQTAMPTPTTGIGDVFSGATVSEGPTAMSGAAAVNSDTANRLLSVIWTLGTSNVSCELVTEYATVELL